MDRVLGKADSQSLEELNQAMVDALKAAATKSLPTAKTGSQLGQDKLFRLITSFRRKLLKLLRLAQRPDDKTDRVCPWAWRIANFD